MRLIQAADKRADILRATLQLVCTHGFHGTSMAMIMAEARVGAGTVYRYFKSKDVLMEVLYGEIRYAADQAMISGLDENQPVRERFMRLWRNRASFLMQHADYQQFIEQFELSPYTFRADDAQRAVSDQIELFFEYARRQQFLKNESTFLLMAMIFAPLHRMVALHRSQKLVLTNDVLDVMAAACWDAVRR